MMMPVMKVGAGIEIEWEESMPLFDYFPIPHVGYIIIIMRKLNRPKTICEKWSNALRMEGSMSEAGNWLRSSTLRAPAKAEFDNALEQTDRRGWGGRSNAPG